MWLSAGVGAWIAGRVVPMVRLVRVPVPGAGTLTRRQCSIVVVLTTTMLHRRGYARAGAGAVPVPVVRERRLGRADLAGPPPDLMPAARLRHPLGFASRSAPPKEAAPRPHSCRCRSPARGDRGSPGQMRATAEPQRPPPAGQIVRSRPRVAGEPRPQAAPAAVRRAQRGLAKLGEALGRRPVLVPPGPQPGGRQPQPVLLRWYRSPRATGARSRPRCPRSRWLGPSRPGRPTARRPPRTGPACSASDAGLPGGDAGLLRRDRGLGGRADQRHLARHPGDLLLNGGEPGQRPAELLALVHVRDGEVEGGAERPRR